MVVLVCIVTNVFHSSMLFPVSECMSKKDSNDFFIKKIRKQILIHLEMKMKNPGVKNRV